MSDDLWYESEKARVNPDAFLSEFDGLREQNRTRIEFDLFWCSLYYDRAYQGFSDGKAWAEIFVDLLDQSSGRLNENVILRIVATLAAKFARQKSAPAILTTMGDWALQRRAEKYGRMLSGVLAECDVYDLQRLSDINMIICGTGGIYAGSRNGRVHCDVVPSHEIYVNVSDARRMCPTMMYRRQIIPRRRLMAMYPKYRDAIEHAPCVDSRDAFDVFQNGDADVLEVVSGWHLPSYEDSDDGRMMVAIPGVTLVDCEWERPRLPIAFARYMIPPDGFYGIGVVPQLVGMQIELNKTLANRQTAMDMCSAPFVAVESGSNVVDSHMTDQIGRIVKYTGTPPTIVTPNPISQAVLEHGDRVKSGMFQNSGVSELAASSMKPAGLNSGKALRTYADMMDDAFHDAMLRRDRQIRDLAEIILDEIESIAEEDGSYRTKYIGPFGVEKIDYRDVCMDRDNVYLKIQSTSALSSTIAGRIEDLNDMIGLGIEFSQEEKERLLNVPDLTESYERRNSMPNLLKQLLEEEMLGEGKWTTPEPRWDLELALTICSQTILMAQIRKAPKDRIELLRKFEVECMNLQAKALEASMPPPVPMPPQGDVGMVPPAPEASPIAGGEMPADAVVMQ